MGITATFSFGDISKLIDNKVEAVENAIVSGMQVIGEQAVTDARTLKGYNDVTGNLISSSSEAVYKRGVLQTDLVANALPGPKGDGAIGAEVGVQFIANLAPKYADNDIALLVGSGMEYGKYVESRGKDVLTGTFLRTVPRMKTLIARLQSKIK